MANFDPFNSDENAEREDAGREFEDYEVYFSVRGLLKSRFGAAMGDEIYSLLFDAAHAVSEQIDLPTVPGILFRPDEEGGEFVGLEMPEDDDEDDDGLYDPGISFLPPDDTYGNDDVEGF